MRDVTMGGTGIGTRARRGTIVLIGVPILALLLALLGANPVRELRGLSTADTDNLPWTILKVETEIANLGTTLSEAAIDPAPETSDVRFRADIALNRLLIISRGEACALFPKDSAPFGTASRTTKTPSSPYSTLILSFPKPISSPCAISPETFAPT